MEVAVGIHRIEVPLGERLLCLYLLVGREGMLLVDTGSDQTPREHLVPYLQSIGRSAEEIDYVVITHSDRDHQGGNATLREIAPRALFMCHPLDQPLIESVDRLVEKRYSEFQQEHEIDENADAKIWIRQNNRSEVPISLTVTGGETLLLDDDLAHPDMAHARSLSRSPEFVRCAGSHRNHCRRRTVEMRPYERRKTRVSSDIPVYPELSRYDTCAQGGFDRYAAHGSLPSVAGSRD